MTTRNFDALFEPRTIALIGASNQPGSVGYVLARNLLEGGFAGPILAVNPHEVSIRSMLSYRSISDLPLVPDLAVVATPTAAVPQVIADLAGRGCRAAVVVTAGFGEGDRAEGHYLQQRMLSAARPGLLRIVGPNCLGFISPARGINASFAHLKPQTGSLALVSQSGAVTAAVIDWASARGIGFSHIVSLGDAADVDFGDMLDHLALDAATSAILLYVENVTAARKFMSAGRIAARSKPVVVIKVGRNAAGSKAARSHTGAMAGSDAVYEAAFHRAGMLRVGELAELFNAVETLGAGLKVAGDRLAIITNGGGLGVIAADAVVGLGGRLAELGEATLSKLDAVLPAAWPRANPVDILGDAGGERYRRALEVVLPDQAQDATLVINCPTGVADCLDAAEGTAAALSVAPGRPLLACWTGERAGDGARRLFAERRIPSYRTPEDAVRAFMHLARYRRHQELLMETPPADPEAGIDLRRIREIIAGPLAEARSFLTEWEAKAVLAAAGIPAVRTLVAASPAEAALRAAEIEGPTVLKILSPDISHKTDVGGVRLALETPAETEKAAAEMLVHVRRLAPEARIAGFTVQPMVTRPHARELIAGIADDPTFGPVILFGHGGVATEIIDDRSIGLPPLNRVLARHMIETTKVSKLLAGFRNQASAAEAVARLLVRLSQLAIEIPEIAELDINPLLADEAGVIALDARIVIRPGAGGRFAIRPYPRELEKTITLPSGAEQRLRPVRPEDEPLLIALFDRSTPADRRLRFFSPLKVLPHAMAARLSQIDYDREMALVAADPRDPAGTLSGVVRLMSDPERERAEFAVMVRSDQKGRGLGFALMQEIVAYARATGIREVFGDVLAENETMLKMAREFGFRPMPDPGDAALVKVVLDTGAAR